MKREVPRMQRATVMHEAGVTFQSGEWMKIALITPGWRPSWDIRSCHLTHRRGEYWEWDGELGAALVSHPIGMYATLALVVLRWK
ncbi:hypothetical protein HYDPIDRAFT_111455 [Hydnomerulius pinastri MD-312]|uniref:Uncharacterized protein n=1 Tax=Hydnomerulius pinastri MD-312 TaxID=994086 RepID=A0A0C9W1N9_9AGAM|nr:hypothetical protein HYDPIDRAFT_111455 [Hydnomerulius pinastri MD-312]